MFGRKYLRTMLLTAAMALGACSSGSDPAPAATPPAPPAPPPPVAETLTVSGFVTDMPIANATVVLTVNGQEFTAANPTGADGSYTVDIETTDTDALVECVAFDPNGPARFTALLNSFAGLQEDADVDGIIDDANITNITTAQQLLAESLAADGSIDDLAELQALAEQVDPDELLELAAAIKVVVDGLQGTVLPEEFTDVLELAQAIVDGTTTFVEDIETTNPGIIDAAIAQVVSDGFATVPFDAESMPGVYIDTSGTQITVLMEDGSGYLAEDELDGQVIDDITWSLTETGALEIAFTGTEDTDTIVLLTDAAGVQTVYVTSVEEGQEQEPGTFSVVRVGFDPAGFDTASATGSYRDPDTDDEDSETEFTVLVTGGSGYEIDIATGVQDGFFTWVVNADAELVITDDDLPDIGETEAGQEEITLLLLEGSTADIRNVLIFENVIGSDEIIEIEALPLEYTSEILTGPMADLANTLLLEGKTYAISDGNEKQLVTFDSDGVFSEIFQDFDEEFGPEFGEDDSGTWFIDADGVIFITFPETEEDPQETDLATVVSGLGQDVMVVSVEEDGVVFELTLNLVTPFTENDNLVGSWDLVEDGVSILETIDFNDDGTGAYFDQGQLDVAFDWVIEPSGRLVLTLDDGPEAEVVITDNIHKLADSTANNLHVFAVIRGDGELINEDADDPEGPPQVFFEVNLVRLP